MKKIFSSVLALTVICGGIAPFAAELPEISLTADAADAVETGKLGDNITYTLDSEGNLTISGTGETYNYNYEAPSPLKQDERIKSVIIKGDVTSIGDDAFYGCTSLESIKIPDSVTSIGRGAFMDCANLSSVIIPDSVTNIGSGAFFRTKWFNDETNKTPLFVINGILIDGTKCSGDVVIPESVTSIGNLAFDKCKSIESITVLNPKCEIYDQADTIYNAYDENGNQTYNGIIKGYDNSTAQVYAEKYKYKFESLGPAPESGDLNSDGKIDANDATLVLVNYSLLSTGEKMQLTESQQKAADVNGDGKIDSSDATTILQYYSYLSTGGKDSFADFMASQK